VCAAFEAAFAKLLWLLVSFRLWRPRWLTSRAIDKQHYITMGGGDKMEAVGSVAADSGSEEHGVRIAVATLSSNSLGQTVRTQCA